MSDLQVISLPLFDVYVEQIHSLFHFTSPTTGASGVTGVVQVGLRVSQVFFSSESLLAVFPVAPRYDVQANL